ncbi:MAG: di-heme oxidoredictase family protein [Polyangiales bacterium]
MKRRWLGVGCALALFACGDDDATDPNEAFSGGRATVFDRTRMAFAQVAPDVEGAREDDFFVGNSIFNRAWATAPASVAQFDGLGPLFNATNCSACHLKDGRGRPPASDAEPFTALLLRLSIPGTDAVGAPIEDPRYGNQLQDNGVLGVAPEARPRVRYVEVPGAFADGEPYTLRHPTYLLDTPAYGAFAPDLQISPRIAPAVFGLGLLEAIPDATLEALADPDDRNGDGISGRVNHVWDQRRGAPAVGRFGWKANQPTIEQQTAAAFQGDIGIGSSLFPLEPCTGEQAACKSAPSGGAPGQTELTDALLASVVSYMHTLAVPARRDLDDAMVRRGQKVFAKARCTSCHLPRLETGDLPGFPEVSRQSIRPYTDLLLHDMGPELADGRPDFEASGSEWRTPPLWGIGLVQTVNQHTFFLHDGRARGLLEAVLAHGGEAAQARDAVRALSRADREALIAFLQSL